MPRPGSPQAAVRSASEPRPSTPATRIGTNFRGVVMIELLELLLWASSSPRSLRRLVLACPNVARAQEFCVESFHQRQVAGFRHKNALVRRGRARLEEGRCRIPQRLDDSTAQSILVVDDDPEIRKLLARYIESQGFRVLLAANCRELNDKLATHHVDLIVLDVMLPDGSGLDVCRDLRARRSSVPIILLTALKEDVDRIIGLEIGADDYLGKPFNPRELIARVRAVLRRRAETLPRAERGEDLSLRGVHRRSAGAARHRSAEAAMSN